MKKGPLGEQGTTWTASVIAALAAVVTLAAFGGPIAAQQRGDDRPDRVRAWFAARYGPGADRGTATPEDLDRLAGLWIEATEPSATEGERAERLGTLIEEMLRVQDAPDGRYSASARAGLTARVDEILGMDVPPDPVPVETAAPATPGRVEVHGRGPVPLVLLSDMDYDGAIYADFVELFRDRFTMYVVTLPGAGGTKPPAFPAGSPPSETAWWDNAAAAVLSVVEERGVDRPVVVGPLSSAYLAARLAIDHPDRFRAAVLLHGLVRSFLSVPGTAGFPAPEQRRAWVDGTLPNLFPAPSADSTLRTYLAGAAASAIDSTRARSLARRAARTHPGVVSRYTTELRSTDLGDDFAALRVPTLVIPSLHDESSPIGGTEVGTAQWQRLRHDQPDIPLTVVPFRATRNYAPVDSPLELGRAIEDFLAGRPVRGKPRDPALTAYRASPRAAVGQVLGATEVEIEYSSPAARGRTVWGGVVPWGSIWRLGANAATRIHFSRDVTVQGQALEAGAYALFMIPNEEEPWTLIFNRTDVQLGTFTYDSTYDALRLDVEPEVAEHREHLAVSLTPDGPVDGTVEISWAGRRVTFDVRAEAGVGMRRVVARPFAGLEDLEWTTLATDTVGDGRAGPVADGRRLSYHHDRAGDTLWIRFDLADRPVVPGLGLNVAVDTDMDQGSGAAWWGGNGGFRYDRVITAWLVPGTGNEFWGTVGLSDPSGVAAGDYAALGRENVTFSASDDGRTWVVGVPPRDLAPDGRMRLVGTVGTNVFWNDELVDEGSVELDLRDEGRR